MLYTVYQITNLVNQKVYIGVHKTNNPNDNYMGSGRAIKNAITKYGRENFKKEVLFVFENKEDAFKKEQELVNSEFVSTSNTYNGKLGGYGGWDHVRTPEIQALAVENIKEFYNTDKGKELRSQVSERFKGHVPHNKGKKTGAVHSKEFKEETRKRRQNTIWINDGINETYISASDIIPKGWSKGRLINNHPSISKKFILIMQKETIEIENLKNWCKENSLDYHRIFSCVDKGMITPSGKRESDTRKFMIGKEIKSI